MYFGGSVMAPLVLGSLVKVILSVIPKEKKVGTCWMTANSVLGLHLQQALKEIMVWVGWRLDRSSEQIF
jgi:hypothetical protein